MRGAYKQMIASARTFATKPENNMSLTASPPPAKTTAFGGVATGSMNAHDVAQVAGTSSNAGATPMRS
eukprot:COSAG06_NODE_451_length_15558_cov_3.421243_8_plen_67_part_01